MITVSLIPSSSAIFSVLGFICKYPQGWTLAFYNLQWSSLEKFPQFMHFHPKDKYIFYIKFTLQKLR